MVRFMEKELSDMTLEELWELFPIFLVPHDEKWEEYYREAEPVLKNALRGFGSVRISHIGSTAVRDIMAKNIVDILVEISQGASLEEAARRIEQSGFLRMSSEEKRISLNRGYTKNGFADKVYHVHLRFFGDNDELYFRDYLNEHPEEARKYEALKLELSKKYEHDRDAYTAAKTEFIRSRTLEARRLYPNRY